MLRSRDFGRTFNEEVACSRRPGKAFDRRLGVKIQTVALWQVHAWMLGVEELLAIDPQSFRRDYRGPVTVPPGFDAACPWCRNPLVYECLSCGLLSCCADAKEHSCAWCRASGPVHVAPGPLLEPEPYEPPSVREKIWNAWLDFNEWVYDLMTRKNRPKSMDEAEAEFRRLKKP